MAKSVDADKNFEIVKRLEKKPYIRYLRYLLTKGYSPAAITSSLNSLGYPSVSSGNILTYFETAILPIVKKFKIKKVYSRLLKNLEQGKTDYQIISYKDLSYDPELQLSFLKFLNKMDVICLWGTEVRSYYASAGCEIPTGDEGPLVSGDCSLSNVHSVLAHPKREIIDQLLIDGYSIDKTLKKLRDDYQVKGINRPEILTYSKCFFNYQQKTLIDLSEQIENDIDELEGELEQLEKAEISLPQKYIAKQEMERRLQFLRQSLKAAKSEGSMLAFNYASIELKDVIKAFKDMFVSTKQLYDFHKNFTERENVPTLNMLVKNMQIISEQMMKLLDKDSEGKVLTQQSLIEILNKKHEEELKAKEIEALGEEVEFEEIMGSENV